MKLSWLTTFLAALLLGATPLFVTGCSEEDTGDAVEEATDDAEDTANEVAGDAEDMADDLDK